MAAVPALRRILTPIALPFGLAIAPTYALAAEAIPCTSEGHDPAIASLSKADVQRDLDGWLNWTKSTHPKIEHSVDIAVLEARARAISDNLPSRLTRQQAWRAMAQLNPLLADAHMGLEAPALEDASEPSTAIQVYLEHTGLRVAGQNALIPEGALIESINGCAVGDIIAQLEPLTRGETRALRYQIISLKIGEYLAMAVSPGEPMTLEYVAADGISSSVKGMIHYGSASAARSAYSLSWDEDVATLRVPSFSREREDEFAAFLQTSFAEIAGNDTSALLIDLRDNGGGARELSDRLMAYLTDRPYSPITGVSARITEANMALIPGSRPGDVVTVPFQQTVTPPAELEHRFTGQVTVAIGPATYSQAIVFAATVADHEVGNLCGMPTEGAANQTGQVQKHRLAHTGFTVRAPLYVLYRASGDRSSKPLVPAEAC